MFCCPLIIWEGVSAKSNERHCNATVQTHMIVSHSLYPFSCMFLAFPPLCSVFLAFASMLISLKHWTIYRFKKLVYTSYFIVYSCPINILHFILEEITDVEVIKSIIEECKSKHRSQEIFPVSRDLICDPIHHP